jgi:hypothetical protein
VLLQAEVKESKYFYALPLGSASGSAVDVNFYYYFKSARKPLFRINTMFMTR